MTQADLGLASDEVVEKEIKGDYWERALCFYSQKRGTFWFTDKRIIFRGGLATSLDIPYSEMKEVKTCNVGDFVQIMPTGIKVSTQKGKSYKLSVLGRKEILAFIEKKRQEVSAAL